MLRKAARKIKRGVARSLGRASNSSSSAHKPFLQFAPPGHFYSPIPDAAAFRNLAEEVIEPSGIDLQTGSQRDLLERLSEFYAELPFPENPTPGHRFSFANKYFRYADAIYLYGLLRHFQPRRVIEVGSGYSSAAALDASERFLGNSIEFTFIEPYPARLRQLLHAEDWTRVRLLQEPVQAAPLELFDTLQPNDILLIDSSHVSKVGSDVNHLLFRVLPRLQPGVLVHLHDIFYPFEYPKEWFEMGRAWNEAYLVRAFLQYNKACSVVLFASHAGRCFPDFLAEKMPLCLKDTGASLWLRKL